MVTKWHVNPETMKPGKCEANIRCDFANAGGQEPPHFATQKEAQAALDKDMAHLSVPESLNKKSSGVAKPSKTVVPLSKKRFEELAVEEKAIEDRVAASRNQLKRAEMHLDGLYLEFYDDAEMAKDEDNMNYYINSENDVIVAQQANERLEKEMTEFQNAHGKQLADFRSKKLTKTGFAKLHDERSEMGWARDAAEVEYDAAHEMLTIQEERIKDGDDDPENPNVAHRLKMLKKEFDQAGLRNFRAKERVERFTANYGQKMKAYEEQHGKYDVMKELEKALGL